MKTPIKSRTIKKSFDILENQLKAELEKEGFVVSGVTDYQQLFKDKLGITYKSHKVYDVINPFLTYETLKILPYSECIVVPASITIIELYPGIVEVIPNNPNEYIVMNMDNTELQNLAEEVNKRLYKIIHALDLEISYTPDLVTSWG